MKKTLYDKPCTVCGAKAGQECLLNGNGMGRLTHIDRQDHTKEA